MSDQQLVFEFIADDSKVQSALSNVGKKADGVGNDITKAFSKKELFGSDKAVDFKNIVSKVGDEVSGLTGRFGQLGLAVGGIAIAGLAVKKAFDFAVAGEQIKQINTSFEVLTSQAGVNAVQLRQDLETAAGGFADMENILKTASIGATEFGDQVERLPDLLKLARAASIQFGGTVDQQFQTIVQAVASGNTRALRQIGLFVDATKAVDEFASANGRARGELTQVAERQAIMNAVLEKGQKVYAGVDIENGSLQQSTQALAVSFDDLNDSLALIANAAFGQIFKDIADGVSSAARAIAGLGPDSEGPIKRLKTISKELEDLQARLNLLNEDAVENNKKLKESQDLLSRQREGAAGFFESLIAQFTDSGVDARFMQKQVDDVVTQMKRLEEEKIKIQKTLAPNEKEALFNDTGAKAKLEATKKFNDQIRSIEAETSRLRLQNVLASSTTEQALQFQVEEAERQSNARKLAIRQQFSSDFAVLDTQDKQFQKDRTQLSEERQVQIRKEFDLRRIDLTRQQNKLLAAEAERSAQEIQNIERDSAEKQAKEEEARRAQALNLTKQFYTGLVSVATAGLARVGAQLIEGGSAFSNFAGQVYNILGDLAIQIGTALIGIGLGIEGLKNALLTLNSGAAIAAGAALIVAGGALKAIAGQNGVGGASPSTGTGGGTAGGGGISGNTGPETPIIAPQDQERIAPKTELYFTVQGNILGTSDKSLALAMTELLDEQFSSQGLVFKGRA